jgi:hypothetical protein
MLLGFTLVARDFLGTASNPQILGKGEYDRVIPHFPFPIDKVYKLMS